LRGIAVGLPYKGHTSGLRTEHERESRK